MNTDQDQEQVPDQSTTPSKWLQLFLALNLAILVGFFIWEVGGSSFKSDEELEKVIERQEDDIKKAMESNLAPVDYTGKLSDVVELVINATDAGEWVHLSFANGKQFKQVEIAKDSIEWDIAFRRAKIVTNGGDTGKKGKATVAVMPTNDFGSVFSAPLEGYVADAHGDNTIETKSRPELDKWYHYDFWTHHLKTKELIYIMKTADGHHVKFQIVDYYCGFAAGCYTIKFKYRGSEGISFSD